ncbi:MAG TPA: STAS domain-containing protein [Bacteroidota bacterium]|nr:STAS domain-containing protein [Bacteroidota bacterium]
MEQATRVSTTSNQRVGIIGLAGDVTADAEQEIVDAFRKLEQDGLRKFLLKFDQATYINSSGLAIIISLVSESKKKKQTIAASGLSNHFKKVFDVIGLTDFMDLYPTEEEAIRKL